MAFTTAVSRRTAEQAQAAGVNIHINSCLNLARDTVASRDASKCPKWTIECIRKGAPEETIIDKLVEGGMTEADAKAHLKECIKSVSA